MRSRLYRSRSDCILGGVCGGLAQYLALDPTLVRILFVVIALANGMGVFLYLLLWVVLPLEGVSARLEDRVQAGAQEMSQKAGELGGEVGAISRARDPRLITWIGAVLVFFGGFALLRNLNLPWLAWLDFDVLWPVLLVAIGVMILLRRGSGGNE